MICYHKKFRKDLYKTDGLVGGKCTECGDMVTLSTIPEKKDPCYHVCSGNCRRVGCNCMCGEWHEPPEQPTFTLHHKNGSGEQPKCEKCYKHFISIECNCPCHEAKELITKEMLETAARKSNEDMKKSVEPQIEDWEIMKGIFDMVYQWGRVGIVVDFSANAYQSLIKDLLQKQKERLEQELDKERTMWRNKIWNQAKKELTQELLGKLPKKLKECECEDTLGYHSKDCTFYPQGWNECLEEVSNIIKLHLDE